MDKAVKLLREAEIEYLTPFIKLWLSFNRWYKKAFDYDPNIKTDAEAIKKCKEENNNLKKAFLDLFNYNNSDEGKLFRESIENLILKTCDYNLKDKEGNLIFNLDPLNAEKIIFIEPNNVIKPKADFIVISNKVFIPLEYQEKLFKILLDIIYGIRCDLIHGNFDIEDKNFLKLVENSYKILCPLMERLLLEGKKDAS